MATRLQRLILAAVTALVIGLGGFGLFLAEASSVRAAAADRPVYVEPAAAERYGVSDGAAELAPIPGLPY